jgi:fructose-1,6-bisphosphatase/inositol monophosphatase family enzyme
MNSSNADLLDLALTTAQVAGELVLRRRREGVTVADLKSSPVDVVTLADRESETLIRSLLHDARPDDGFFGEEAAGGIAEQDAGTSGLTWIVDPIDGTVNYLYDIPHYAISIAVVEGSADPLTWRALAGVVLNPATGEVYTAAAGGGAYLGDRALAVAPAVDLSQALVGTGFSYSSETRAHQGAVVSRPRHPPLRVCSARPVRRRVWTLERLLRAGFESVGPRGGRPYRARIRRDGGGLEWAAGQQRVRNRGSGKRGAGALQTPARLRHLTKRWPKPPLIAMLLKFRYLSVIIPAG